MPIEPKDVVTWLIGGSTLLVAFLGWRLNAKAAKQERRRQREADESIWSLAAHEYPETLPFVRLTLKLERPDENRFHLVSLKVRSPRGALIAPEVSVIFSGDGRSRSQVVEDELARALVVESDLVLHRGYHAGRESVERSYAPYSFYLLMPKRPIFSLKDREKARISAAVASRSSSRRERTLTITSPPISWQRTTDSSRT